ncbi:formylglycine-generating enzyme family protein [Porticoccus sp. W117]|uniref:formylglycine-generating enzyme family protein n=1 Tax=Porticoccus sp. W117 TaxID=3054777 RepID=UPI0025996677|nr:formylglycine-generating enzyme family protein [Porticoccus sp. W117]MDM3870050.1 formylglycine-generating enzyme family protein [Porticoccus sp. W117]
MKSTKQEKFLLPKLSGLAVALLLVGCEREGGSGAGVSAPYSDQAASQPVVCTSCGDLGKLSPRQQAMQQVKQVADSQPKADGGTPEGMVLIPAGTYTLSDTVTHSTMSPLARRGFNRPPVYTYETEAFWIDAHEVTNAEFKQFVDATGYVTTAEKPFDPADFPGLSAQQLAEVRATFKPGAVVFTPPDHAVELDTFNQFLQWWSYVPGASWKYPKGPGSDIADMMDHPVVNVSWYDAKAYAEWAGKQLPNTHQWEIAARGGLVGKEFVWGEAQLGKGGESGREYQANIWQGEFPQANNKADGFVSTAPVGSFPANGFGIYDMAGNVWEWVDDLAPGYPAESGYRTQRGGSYLCSDVYCAAFRPAHSAGSDAYTGLGHTGFRCIRMKQ